MSNAKIEGSELKRIVLDVLAPKAWKTLVEHYPKQADKMLEAIKGKDGRSYNLPGTGFSKVSMGCVARSD